MAATRWQQDQRQVAPKGAERQQALSIGARSHVACTKPLSIGCGLYTSAIYHLAKQTHNNPNELQRGGALTARVLLALVAQSAPCASACPSRKHNLSKESCKLTNKWPECGA